MNYVVSEAEVQIVIAAMRLWRERIQNESNTTPRKIYPLMVELNKACETFDSLEKKLTSVREMICDPPYHRV
jgi:hypothetical protein